MWRCTEDYWGYCNDKPAFEVEPIDITESKKAIIEESYKITYTPTMSGGRCKLDPKTCNNYLSYNMLMVGTLPSSQKKSEEPVTEQPKIRPEPSKKNKANTTADNYI